MKIDDQFSPYLAQIIRPSKENALTHLSTGISDFMKHRDNADIKTINEDAIREKIRASKEAGQRANKQFGLNEKQTNSNIKIADANIDFKNLGQTFDQNLKTETFNEDKKNILWSQRQKEKEYNLDKKRVNATIGYKNKSLGIQQQRVNILKNNRKKTTSPTTNKKAPATDLTELNKIIAKRNAPKTERTVVRKGKQNGKTVIQYSDGSVEYGN